VSLTLVLPAKFEERVGYTPKAIEIKIARAVWLEGFEYFKAPDGKITVIMEGYERWAAGLPRVEWRSDPTVFASLSNGTAQPAVKRSSKAG
jgi:hypothetical protein